MDTTAILLKDILINARQESHRMRHYFLGVEHLFIGLLEIRRGLASSIVIEMGLQPDYLVDAIRRKAGKGSKHLLWSGFPTTPRSEVVLTIALEIANEQQRNTIQERDLLIAILEEDDNIPIRVLKSLGVTIDEMRRLALNHQTTHFPTQPFVQVDLAPTIEHELSPAQLFVLRRMFYGYSRVRVDTQLTGGYTSATLMVVTPLNIEGLEEAPVVVKIGPADAILDETQRYERYVRTTLPPLTARVEERPIAPETSDLAGVKYTLLTDEYGNPRDMRATVREWSGTKLGQWLHDNLYRVFGERWWKQSRPYRFDVWQEYDWVLPPMLTLKIHEGEDIPQGAKVLKFPIQPQQYSELEYGDTVVIKNFLVQKVDKDHNIVQLALSEGNEININRAYQIEVRGINFDEDTYYRGEVVDKMVGRIWRTRDDQLRHALNMLSPDFDTSKEKIRPFESKKAYSNPLKAYQELLNTSLVGTLSTVHGDLHLGNIMVGPNDSALLIDFGRTREGHTVFDWATLEISIINEMLVPMFEDSWDGARRLLYDIHCATHPSGRLIEEPQEIVDALAAIAELRSIVAQSLAEPNQWHEYYIGLALVSLRAINWDNLPLLARRVMYLLSAYMMNEALHLINGDRDRPPDSTELED